MEVEKWADELAVENGFENNDTDEGENIWCGAADTYSFTDIVNIWGAAKDFSHPGYSATSARTVGFLLSTPRWSGAIPHEWGAAAP